MQGQDINTILSSKHKCKLSPEMKYTALTNSGGTWTDGGLQLSETSLETVQGKGPPQVTPTVIWLRADMNRGAGKGGCYFCFSR